MELLVVVAIIAIVASLLLPALSKAKAPLSAQCSGNQRQLTLTWIICRRPQRRLVPNGERDTVTQKATLWVF